MISKSIFKNYSTIYQLAIRNKQTVDYSKVPKILEKDLIEKFVRGSGPGGSNTNKNSNCAVIKHIPTGIVIKCHETRSLDDNRKRARATLINKLDNLINGCESVDKQIKKLQEKKSLSRQQKKERLRSLKDEWKIRENIN